MLGAEAGQVHRTATRHTGRAGIHRGLEHHTAGCIDCRHTGCCRIEVEEVLAGSRLAGSLHILAVGVGSRIGLGSGFDIRKGLT